jgi:polysaccharide export outer membrane protein
MWLWPLWLVPVVFAGCTNLPAVFPSSGANRAAVEAAPAQDTGIMVVPVDNAAARRVLALTATQNFGAVFGAAGGAGSPVNPGDVLEVSVWEAPPALLFSSALLAPGAVSGGARPTTLPEQMVGRSGKIMVPFVGDVAAAGRQTTEIAADIAQRLRGKANQPQVLVRMLRNNTANVTVVGEVATSTRMPLTPKGERLLDALAAAGGVRQPVNKTTLQLTRGDQVVAMPLDTIIRDPRQNVFLQPDDVVTALFQPLSFTSLGATGQNAEIPFEAQGITLVQALARTGGVQDNRADARGVFIFRLEDPRALPEGSKPVRTTPEGRVAVVYQLDLKNPASFFVAQSFPVRDRDVIYVSNAPVAELQKFLSLISTTLFPVLGVVNTLQ